MADTTYGDISPRTAAYAAVDLLARGIPYLVIEKFGQTKPLPMKKSKVITFRRYNSLSATPNALTEGVTPSAKTLTKTDVSATLSQYGDLVTISDVVMDTHEDPVLKEATDILGEQSAQMIETVRYNVLKAGTNVFYANGAARNAVNTTVTLGLIRQITRALKRQNAKKITTIVRSTPAYGMESVAPSFVCIVHPDMEGDIRNLSGFVPTEKYGTMTPYESEIGKVEEVRFVASTVLVPFADAGAAKAGSGTEMLSTTGVNADVYPMLFIGRDAYGIVPLKGANALTPMVVNPRPSDSDPLAQRGHVGWKAMQTAVILNDLWMVRAEVSAKLNP